MGIYAYANTYMHVMITLKKEAMNVKESGKGYIEGLERGTGKMKCN